MYEGTIRNALKEKGHTEIDPRHIEGFMRLEHDALDGLSPAQFDAEVEIGIDCVIEGGTEEAESCAQSFNL